MNACDRALHNRSNFQLWLIANNVSMPAILRTLFPDLDLSFHSKSSLIIRKSHSMAIELHKRLEHQVSVTTNDVSWALCFYHSRVGTVKSAVRTDVRCGKGGDTEISPVDAASDGAEVGVAVGSAVRWSLGDNRMGRHSSQFDHLQHTRHFVTISCRQSLSWNTPINEVEYWLLSTRHDFSHG